jgi:hypothetical protein
MCVFNCICLDVWVGFIYKVKMNSVTESEREGERSVSVRMTGVCVSATVSVHACMHIHMRAHTV